MFASKKNRCSFWGPGVGKVELCPLVRKFREKQRQFGNGKTWETLLGEIDCHMYKVYILYIHINITQVVH